VAEDAIIGWKLLNPDGIILLLFYCFIFSSLCFCTLIPHCDVLGVMIFGNYPSGEKLERQDTVKPAVDFFLFAYQDQLNVRHCDWSVIVQNLVKSGI
jgi:hypothetical protein